MDHAVAMARFFELDADGSSEGDGAGLAAR
jgi:hypothetical protein